MGRRSGRGTNKGAPRRTCTLTSLSVAMASKLEGLRAAASVSQITNCAAAMPRRRRRRQMQSRSSSRHGCCNAYSKLLVKSHHAVWRLLRGSMPHPSSSAAFPTFRCRRPRGAPLPSCGCCIGPRRNLPCNLLPDKLLLSTPQPLCRHREARTQPKPRVSPAQRLARCTTRRP